MGLPLRPRAKLRLKSKVRPEKGVFGILAAKRRPFCLWTKGISMMKRSLIAGLGFLVLLLAAQPALADTTIIVNGHRPPPHRYEHHGYDRHFDRPYRYSYDYRPRPYRPVVYAPLYVPPRPRRVVYETTIINPVQPVAFDPAYGATQTSPDFYDAYGRLCRNYETSSLVAGRWKTFYGTACLYSDGAWRVVN